MRKYEEKKNVKKLISIVQNRTLETKIRVQAISALGRLNDVRAVQPIIDVLNESKDLKLQRRSIATLGSLKDTRAVESIISVVNDKNFRKSSIWALDKIGGVKSLNALTIVLTDQTSLGREEAAKALEKAGWNPTTDSEKAYFLVAKRDWVACLKLDSLAVEPLVSTLIDGLDNAKIGALDTLEKLKWTPEQDQTQVYESVKVLKLKMAFYRERIVRGEMPYLNELVGILKKLKIDKETGDLNISNVEFLYLENSITQKINKEKNYINNFRFEINKIKLKVTIIGDRTYLGRENATKNIKIFEVFRSPNRFVTGGMWRNSWTGKPFKEFEWEGSIGNFYRFDGNDVKYLFARYNFSAGREQLISIDFIGDDGNITETIKWGGSKKINTKIDQDKWIEWPDDMSWIATKLKLIEVKLIINKRSHLR
ncbi:MAG: HEAT repeat domain-containing protein [Lutibacter sp.]|nr:HEAT repeat domain-containing protein [Lutibacter sp.]